MKRILICPLNWGLGHATRCIPIIRNLEARGHRVIIASDGVALKLLKEEFPDNIFYELPGWGVTYPSTSIVINILASAHSMFKAVINEKKKVQEIVEKENIDIVISDNRFGCINDGCYNVFISHQIDLISPKLTNKLVNKINKSYIKKFDEIWIPDFKNEPNLTGILSHSDHTIHPKHYIGPLSRFEKKEMPIEYDILAVISGPEPQRTYLQNKLEKQLATLPYRSILVCGNPNEPESHDVNENFSKVGFLTAEDLNKKIQSSRMIITRSGYTTVMDLVKLGKTALMIPTPGQTEQVYLAKKYQEEGLFLTAKQSDFDLAQLIPQLEKHVLPIQFDLSNKLLDERLDAITSQA